MTLPRIKYPVLIAIIIVLIAGACKKPIFDAIVAGFAELVEKPPGIPCQQAYSDSTLTGNELTFNKDHVLCVYITMDASDFEMMRHESRFGPDIREDDGGAAIAAAFEYLLQCDVPFPNYFNWYSANLEIDGILVKNAGIRKKGLLGSVLCTSPAIKINTSKYIAGQTIGNVDNITLNNNAEDRSNIIQCLNYKVFELAGYPAPRANFANVTVNNEALGIYTHLEPIDEKFLKRQFGNSTGNLYEAETSDFNRKWLERWSSVTPNTDRSRDPLGKIAFVLESSKDNTLIQDLSKYININNFITYWALEILLNHVDGFCKNRNNVYLYFDPGDGNRAVFLPWGINKLHLKEQNIGDFMNSELPRRLSRIPEIRLALKNELERIKENAWKTAELIELIDHYSALAIQGQNDPEYLTFVSDLKTWVLDRKSVIEGFLTEEIPIGNATPSDKCFDDSE